MEINELLEELANASLVEIHEDEIKISENYTHIRERVAIESDLVEVTKYNLSDKVQIDLTVLEQETQIKEINDLLACVLLLQELTYTGPTENIPERFFPLQEEYIHAFVVAYPAGILFCWKEDSDYSGTMANRLSNLANSDQIPDHFGTASVHGPHAVEILKDKFDVTVAPTILFFNDGEVDARLIGQYPESAIQREIDIISDKIDENKIVRN